MYCYPRLRALREDHDLKQADIGRLLGTTQQQYYKYEKGIQEIPIHHLITLADYYGVSTDYLLERKTNSMESEVIAVYLPRLRDLREDHNLKQAQVAALLGIDQRVYSNYETGKRDLPLRHLVLLADYYHVSTDYLLNRKTGH